MKKYDQIHETVLKSIFDMYEDIKSLTNGELADMINKHRNSRVIRSIARSSSDLICVFPVLTSRNISIDVQAMVSKLLRKTVYPCFRCFSLLSSFLMLRMHISISILSIPISTNPPSSLIWMM